MKDEGAGEAAIVVDLGFGDAGKGVVTDHLVRTLGAHTVVRFCGGAQAGHNVVTRDGRHHTFAQLGAGSFVPGVRTFCSRHVVLHPTALLLEVAHLATVGVRDALERVELSEQALVITPFHQAAGRVREHARGDAAHGSCGVGVGETVRDALHEAREHRGSIRMRDLRDLDALRTTGAQLRERLRERLASEVGAPSGWSDDERRIFDDEGVLDRWIARLRELPRGCIVDDGEALDRLHARTGAIVFEGAQGVLLDEWRGFHPHTTWSTCTFDNALELLRGRDRAVTRFGVLRTYATRHGEGPLPTEDSSLDARLPEAHNATHPYQGRFRRGWFDAVLTRYALEATSGVDRLVLTHLDTIDRLAPLRIARAYASEAGTLERLPLGAKGDLAHTAGLTALLREVSPIYATTSPDRASALPALEEAIGSVASLVVTGPTADDVHPR